MFTNDKLLIAPSLLAANPMCLEMEIKKVEEGGCDLLHIDVMDGHFVPNLSFSPDIVKAARKITDLFFDVHLMLSEPEKYIEVFASSGADLITVHFETVADVKAISEKIHSLGIKAGISIKPGTKAEEVLPYIKYFDLVLVMSVEPGFGGQSYMDSVNEKITTLRKCINENGLNTLIEVDGGIKVDNAHIPYNAGANVLVAGSAVFNSESASDTIGLLKGIANKEQ